MRRIAQNCAELRRIALTCNSGNSPLPLTSQMVCSSERASVPETREAVEAPRPAGAPARSATRTENERAERCWGVITMYRLTELRAGTTPVVIPSSIVSKGCISPSPPARIAGGGPSFCSNVRE